MHPIDVVYTVCGIPSNEHCKQTDELAWSIYSVHKFMPWVRYIWIVVNDEFDAKHLLTPKAFTGHDIKWVKVSEIVPNKYLPTYNSNVVESWIWKIKGLSDTFVYFCDDMYIGQPLVPEDFFVGPSQTPILRIDSGATHHPVPSGLKSRIPYVRMWSAAYKKYGINFTRITHQALPQRVSLMEHFYIKYRKQIKNASKNAERSGEYDFNLLRFSSSLAVMTGDSFLKVTFKNDDYFCECNEFDEIKNIVNVRPRFFCVNNNYQDNKVFFEMMKKYYNTSFLYSIVS
jgi:hypothetical protein